MPEKITSVKQHVRCLTHSKEPNSWITRPGINALGMGLHPRCCRGSEVSPFRFKLGAAGEGLCASTSFSLQCKKVLSCNRVSWAKISPRYCNMVLWERQSSFKLRYEGLNYHPVNYLWSTIRWKIVIKGGKHMTHASVLRLLLWHETQTKFAHCEASSHFPISRQPYGGQGWLSIKCSEGLMRNFS